MTRSLITGASGSVGRALAAALTRRGHDVIALSRAEGDVTDPATWAQLPSVDHVFHLAARSFIPDSWRDPAGFLQTNVVGTARALEFCRTHGAHLVFVSAYLYGRPARLPIGEDDPQEPNNPYALSKFLAERTCRFAATSMSTAVTVVRPFNVYGFGQRPEFLIPTILKQLANDSTIRVDDLTPRRDYVWLDDLVEALVCVARDPKGYRVFNIGSGVSYSVREIIEVIQAAAGTCLPVVSNGTQRVNEIAEVRADITRARTVLGWQPTCAFPEGIGRLVQADRVQAREKRD